MSNEMKRFIEVSSFLSCFLPGTVYSFLAVLNLDPPSHFLLVLSPIHYEKKKQLSLDPFWIASGFGSRVPWVLASEKNEAVLLRDMNYIKIKRLLLVSRLSSTICHRTIPSLQKSSQKVTPIHE